VDDAGVGTTFDHDASGAFPLAIRIALDEAAMRGERPRLLRVHRAGAALPDLEPWSQEAGVTFQPGDEWNEVAASAAPSHAIDLLQGFTRSRRRGFALPRAALALAALLVLLQLGFTAFDAYRLSREKAALQAKQEEIFRATFPDAKVVVDPDLQMARNRAELERSRGIASGDEFLARLTEAGRGSNAPVKSVRYADGKLEVQR
jgi:general secretion pathway protein L